MYRRGTDRDCPYCSQIGPVRRLLDDLSPLPQILAILIAMVVVAAILGFHPWA
jgi:hypothetical protein